MSLGTFGINIAPDPIIKQELKTKYMTPNGSLGFTFTPPATQFNLERLISGLTGGTRENGCAIENGFLEDFYWLTLVNTTTQDVTINLQESDDDFFDPYTPIGDILVIPAGFVGVTSITGLGLAITRGKYYKFGGIGDPTITGDISKSYSYIVDYGTNPVMPKKYVIGKRDLEQTSGFLNAYWGLTKNLFTTTSGNARQPMMFNGKLTVVTLNKYQKPNSGTWFFKVRKNNVELFSEAIDLVLEVQTFNPNIEFLRGDTIEFHCTKSLSNSNAHFQAAFLFEELS